MDYAPDRIPRFFATEDVDVDYSRVLMKVKLPKAQ